MQQRLGLAYIFLTYKKPLNILHATKRKFLSIINIKSELGFGSLIHEVMTLSIRFYNNSRLAAVFSDDLLSLLF